MGKGSDALDRRHHLAAALTTPRLAPRRLKNVVLDPQTTKRQCRDFALPLELQFALGRWWHAGEQ